VTTSLPMTFGRRTSIIKRTIRARRAPR
jgi:hypothetical protein